MNLRSVCIILISFAVGSSRVSGQALKSDTINVLNYTIHLDLKHLSHQQLYGAADITAIPGMASINSFSLDFRKLTVDSVLLNGIVHSGYVYNDTVLRILLSTPFSIADTFVLRVVYHGIPLIEPYNWGGFHFLSDSTLAYNLGVAFDDYPHNYGRVWFPCLDDFIDRATYDFFIRTKATHKAVCGGIFQGSNLNPDGSITWYWKLEQSIPTYLASVAVGEFSVLSSVYHGISDTIPILIYVRPSDSAKAVGSFSNLDEMLNIFESRYGPYRWPRVGYVGTTKGAMEHAMNIAMPRNLITGNFSYDWLVAHELSHHWFGDLVTCSSAEDMWLNEGWARYSESVYTEGMSGWQTYKAGIMNLQKQVLNFAHTNASGGDGVYFPLYPVPQTHTYGTTVYDKGCLIAHTLRGYLGDSVFFDAIKALLNNFAFQPVSSYQMRDYLSQHTGINLTPFFDGWVFTPGFPHFSIDSVQSIQHAGGWNVTVYVKQKMVGRTTLVNNNVVEIGFYADINTCEIRRLSFSGANGLGTFWLPFKPILVLMDPEDRLSDAITAETVMITAPSQPQFNNMFFRLKANTITDTLFARIEHSFVPPDPLPQPVAGLTLSPNRYWKITGIIPPGSSVEGIFSYSTGNQFDNALITNTTDSLIILYRPHAGEAWHGIPFIKSANPNVGNITVSDFQPGEYVLAKWDKDHIGIEAVATKSGSSIQIYPNPASDKIILRSEGPGKLTIRIYDLKGELLGQMEVQPSEGESYVDLATFNRGIYLIEVLDEHGVEIASKKITLGK